MSRWDRLRPTPGALVGLVVVAALVAVVVVPNLFEARVNTTHHPVNVLPRLVEAQTLFREGDKDGDATLDYGTVAELDSAGVLHSGYAHAMESHAFGYRYEVQPSPTTPEFLWMATATPLEPGAGKRCWVVNQAGEVHWREGRPFELRDDCAIPADAVPLRPVRSE